MIAAMARHSHDPIAKFIRWLEDARRARIPNYEAMALATAARNGKTSEAIALSAQGASHSPPLRMRLTFGFRHSSAVTTPETDSAARSPERPRAMHLKSAAGRSTFSFRGKLHAP
jgi:hypothetical protein